MGLCNSLALFVQLDIHLLPLYTVDYCSSLSLVVKSDWFICLGTTVCSLTTVNLLPVMYCRTIVHLSLQLISCLRYTHYGSSLNFVRLQLSLALVVHSGRLVSLAFFVQYQTKLWFISRLLHTVKTTVHLLPWL